jgi:hypothetical protein
MREIREREDECKRDDVYDDKQSLKYYAMKRVTEMRLTEEIEKRLQQLSAIQESLVKTRTELKTLEKSHSTYTDEWVDCYNVERQKAGIPAFVPSKDQFAEYEKYQLL